MDLKNLQNAFGQQVVLGIAGLKEQSTLLFECGAGPAQVQYNCLSTTARFTCSSPFTCYDWFNCRRSAPAFSCGIDPASFVCVSGYLLCF